MVQQESQNDPRNGLDCHLHTVTQHELMSITTNEASKSSPTPVPGHTCEHCVDCVDNAKMSV